MKWDSRGQQHRLTLPSWILALFFALTLGLGNIGTAEASDGHQPWRAEVERLALERFGQICPGCSQNGELQSVEIVATGTGYDVWVHWDAASVSSVQRMTVPKGTTYTANIYRRTDRQGNVLTRDQQGKGRRTIARVLSVSLTWTIPKSALQD